MISHLTGLTESLSKDLGSEADLAQLNELLAPAEALLTAKESEPRRPIVFVLGPPRSGTTLMSQALAATRAFGITSNFVARFWRAPSIGFHLENSLRPAANDVTFRSVRGRTTGASEPHEFGYYWSSWFDLGQSTHRLGTEQLERVDIAGLRKSIAAMETACGRPLMFKNNTWFTFQAGWLARRFPTSILVACRRDPFFVAQSIYVQRQALGDVSRWWSVRPPNYPELIDLSPLEQVAAQAVEIERGMQKELESVPAARVVQADYDQVCEHPGRVLNDIFRACADVGEAVKPLGQIPERFNSTNHLVLSADDAGKLRRFVEGRLAAE